MPLGRSVLSGAAGKHMTLQQRWAEKKITISHLPNGALTRGDKLRPVRNCLRTGVSPGALQVDINAPAQFQLRLALLPPNKTLWSDVPTSHLFLFLLLVLCIEPRASSILDNTLPWHSLYFF